MILGKYGEYQVLLREDSAPYPILRAVGERSSDDWSLIGMYEWLRLKSRDDWRARLAPYPECHAMLIVALNWDCDHNCPREDM